MNKLFKGMLTVSLAAMLAVPAVACGTKEVGREVDDTKAQLYVSNFNGGVGTDWLIEEAIPRFEAAYATKEFIPGKIGVQVHVEKHKSSVDGLAGQIKTAKPDVYFLENVNYYDCISRGLFLDITDIVTEPLTEYGESGTIEDKLYADQVNFWKTPQGKYYALPHAQSPTLITYDADLFDRLGLYFGADGKLGKKSTDTGLSAGPDAQTGTYDDGMPATYEQFYTLCQKIKQRGVSPMVWSGQYGFYVTRFSKQLRVDFEGAEEAMNAYDFDGVATKLVDSIAADGTITYKDPVTITEENGYQVFSSASYYYAFDFLKNVYDGGYYDGKSFNENTSHRGAQDLFLKSSYRSDAKDIAMIVEGLYWVNEAEATFREMSNQPGASLQERNLRVMPLPKATEAQVGEKTTLVDSLNQMAFIANKTDRSEAQTELAKTFLQFLSTQESLKEFLTETGLPRNYNVDYSDILDTLCPYSQSVIEMLSNCNYIMPASSSTVFQKNHLALFNDNEMGTKRGDDPMILIKDNPSMTSLALFNEFKSKYSATQWATMR